jgi:hypothetical protein
MFGVVGNTLAETRYKLILEQRCDVKRRGVQNDEKTKFLNPGFEHDLIIRRIRRRFKSDIIFCEVEEQVLCAAELLENLSRKGCVIIILTYLMVIQSGIELRLPKDKSSSGR